MYTVKHVSRMTGIPADTLRVWERRYAVVVPTRSESGYRLYDESALRRLVEMKSLVESGWPARRAAERVKADAGATGVVPADPGAAPTHDPDLGPSLVDLAQDLDPARLESELTRAFATDDFETLVRDWMLPALADLGSAWRSSQVTVAGEHFVSASLQRYVAGVMAAAHPPAGAPRVLAGLPRGARHELGILTFAAAARRAGLDVVYVGPDLPAQSWAETARASRAVAAVIAVPTPDELPAARDTVAALASAAPDVLVLAGGGCQDEVGPPARSLGHDLVAAVHDLHRTLTDAGAA